MNESTVGKDAESTLVARDCLACLFKEQGYNEKALRIFEDVLARRQKVLGWDDSITFVSAHQLAELLQIISLFIDAEALYQRVWCSRSQVLGQDAKATMASKNNLALCVRGLKDHHQALQLELLDDRIRVYGLLSTEVILTKNNLAMDYYDLGEFDKAQALLQEVVKFRRDRLGRFHQDFLLSSSNLGLVQQKQQDCPNAGALFQEIMVVRELKHGCNHVLTVDTIGNLSTCLRTQKKHVEAISLAENPLRLHRKELGDSHTDTIPAVKFLVSSQCLAEKFSDAEDTYREYFEMRKRCPEREVKISLYALQNYGFVLTSRQKYQNAERCFLKAYKGRQIITGIDSEDTFRSGESLLVCLQAQPRLSEAEQLCLTLTSLSEVTLGECHNQTAQFLAHLANIFQARGRFLENIEKLKLILKRLERNNSAVTLQSVTFQNRANALFAQKRYREAQDFLKNYSSLQKITHGASSLEVSDVALQLGLITHEQGRFNAYRDNFERARQIYESCGKVSEEEYLKVITSIYEVLCKLNRYKEARSLCDRALTLDNFLWTLKRPLRHLTAELAYHVYRTGLVDTKTPKLWRLGSSLTAPKFYQRIILRYLEPERTWREYCGERIEDQRL